MGILIDYQGIGDYFEYRPPNVPDMPSSYWSESSWIRAPIEYVTFDDLYATQPWYHPGVMQHKTYGMGFVVICSAGKFIFDGHHTAIREKVHGASGFHAHVKRPEEDFNEW